MISGKWKQVNEPSFSKIIDALKMKSSKNNRYTFMSDLALTDYLKENYPIRKLLTQNIKFLPKSNRNRDVSIRKVLGIFRKLILSNV
jgi:hypothetical protein